MENRTKEELFQIEVLVARELKNVCSTIAAKSGMIFSEVSSDTDMPLLSLKKGEREYLLLIVVNLLNAVEILTELRQKYAGSSVRYIYAVIPTQCKDLMTRFEASIVAHDIRACPCFFCLFCLLF